MKQFESPQTSLPTPSKVDFKIMKETADDDLSHDSSLNSGQLKLPSSENLEVQNGSKKMLEIVDLNSSTRVSCDSSFKRDAGWMPNCGVREKENLITENGLPHELISDYPPAQPNADTGQCVSTAEKTSEKPNQDGQESKLGTEDLADCSTEENIGIKSTMQVPGTSVSLSASSEAQGELESDGAITEKRTLVITEMSDDHHTSKLNGGSDCEKPQVTVGNGDLLSEGDDLEPVSTTGKLEQVSVMQSEEELSSLDEPPLHSGDVEVEGLSELAVRPLISHSDKSSSRESDVPHSTEGCTEEPDAVSRGPIGSVNFHSSELKSEDMDTENLDSTSGNLEKVVHDLHGGFSKSNSLDSPEELLETEAADSLNAPLANANSEVPGRILEELESLDVCGEPDLLDEPVAEQELVSCNKAEPVTEEELVRCVESEPVLEAELVSHVDPEPISAEELVSRDEPEPVVEEELVSRDEPEPSAEEELVFHVEPELAVEEELVSRDEPDFATEEELVSQDEPELAAEEELVSRDEPEPFSEQEIVSCVEPEPVAEEELVSRVETDPVEEEELVSRVETDPVEEEELVSRVETEPIGEEELVSRVETEPVAGEELVSRDEPEPVAGGELISRDEPEPVGEELVSCDEPESVAKGELVSHKVPEPVGDEESPSHVEPQQGDKPVSLNVTTEEELAAHDETEDINETDLLDDHVGEEDLLSGDELEESEDMPAEYTSYGQVESGNLNLTSEDGGALDLKSSSDSVVAEKVSIEDEKVVAEVLSSGGGLTTDTVKLLLPSDQTVNGNEVDSIDELMETEELLSSDEPVNGNKVGSTDELMEPAKLLSSGELVGNRVGANDEFVSSEQLVDGKESGSITEEASELCPTDQSVKADNADFSDEILSTAEFRSLNKSDEANKQYSSANLPSSRDHVKTNNGSCSDRLMQPLASLKAGGENNSIGFKGERNSVPSGDESMETDKLLEFSKDGVKDARLQSSDEPGEPSKLVCSGKEPAELNFSDVSLDGSEVDSLGEQVENEKIAFSDSEELGKTLDAPFIGSKSLKGKNTGNLLDGLISDSEEQVAASVDNDDSSGEKTTVAGENELKCSEKTKDNPCVYPTVWYRQENSKTQKKARSGDSGKKTSLAHANFEDDFEKDLRAMEDSMWLDTDASSRNVVVKRSAPEDSADKRAREALQDNAVPRPTVGKERLTRKRTSDDDTGVGSSDQLKRTKVSIYGAEADSDASSETSRDCDNSSKRPSDCDIGARQVKKVRTGAESKIQGVEKEVLSYRSNLDKIIDQVATGVISGVSENKDTSSDDVVEELRVVASVNKDSGVANKDIPSVPPKAYNPLPFMRKLHAEELKNLNRNDLEELVVQKLCEVVTERCNVGELRQRTQLLEQMVEQWRKKAQLLSKQVRDMEMVMKRFANDQKMKRDRIVLPVKITRSVGLQVHMGQTNQVGLAKTRPSDTGNRHQLRRRPERSTSSPGPSPVNPPPKPPTPTSTPSTPQKVASPVFPKTTTSANTSNTTTTTTSTPPSPITTATAASASAAAASTTTAVTAAAAATTTTCTTTPSSPVVKQVALPQTPTMKTVSTPIKTSVSRSTVINSTGVANVNTSTAGTPVKLPTTAVTANRVVKNATVYSTTATTPIAPKPSQDLIDLTDEEDRAKSNSLRNALAVPSDALIPTTGSITSILPSNAITTSVAGRGIRVVQPHQLTGSSTTTAAILTPTGTTNTSGQRLAYLVPTTTMPAQQRQLLIASTQQQVRAGSVMPGRPAIFFKSTPVMSVSQAGMTPIQAGIPTSTSALLRPNPALASIATQQRPGQIRMPTAGVVTSVGRMGAAVNTLVSTQAAVAAAHPAPLPSLPPYAPTSLNLKLAPPKPELKISKVPTKNTQGIVLSWNMTLSTEHEEVASYQLYAYQEGNAPPSTNLWKKVGDVKALPLPMACTLTQFQEGHKYHFAVRAVDVHMRCGQFSAPGNILLTRK